MSSDDPSRTEVAAAGDPVGALTAADHPAAGPADLPIPGATPAVGPTPTRLPFAARFQAILIGVMILGFALIAQSWSKTLYQIGLPLLVVTAFLQIAFGNIPPAAGFARSLKLLAVTWVAVAAVFGLGILLAPFLIDLGR